MQLIDRLIQDLSLPWAIHSDTLAGLSDAFFAGVRGELAPDVLHFFGRTQPHPAGPMFQRDGNVAIIHIDGILTKAKSFLSEGTTYPALRQAVAAAEAAGGIDAILISADTPGGTMAGVQETGDFLARVGKRKPLYGWADDLAASAGYWLLSQTRMIGANATADVGSIGVLQVHYDRSSRDRQIGVRRTILATGGMKAAGNDTAPMSNEAKAYIMELLNRNYDLFIAAVSRGRKISSSSIRKMQSRIYKPAEAKKLGIIDHVMGRDEWIEFIKRQTRGTVSSYSNWTRSFG